MEKPDRLIFSSVKPGLFPLRSRKEMTLTFAGEYFGLIIMMFARSISEDMQRANSVISGQKNASPSGRNSMYLSSSLLHPLRMHHTRRVRASNPNTCVFCQMPYLFLYDSYVSLKVLIFMIRR
ncbi:MAG: hypothetical protein WCS96_04015 [Victivallales bacterium]